VLSPHGCSNLLCGGGSEEGCAGVVLQLGASQCISSKGKICLGVGFQLELILPVKAGRPSTEHFMKSPSCPLHFFHLGRMFDVLLEN